MAKPATIARQEAAAKGFTQVIGRGNAHIITKNPTTGKCAYDGQVGGGWHYNGDQEIDTAWEADSDQNYIKMVKAGYNLRARKLFNAGDLIQWTDPISGQYVKFQPQNFQWIDGTTGSNSLISVAQAISAPTVDDDKLYWANAFGPNRHFQYTAGPTRLIKHLIIDSAANIPACPTWITNPWLELTFTLTPSSGVIMFVDGVAWNQATTKTTASAIEFRLPSGQVVWSMAAPLAYDSSEMGEPCTGQIKLYVNKKIKYAAVRFPKSWIDTAVFPIMLDPAVDYQVAAGEDDGYVMAETLDKTSPYVLIGKNGVQIYDTWAMFAGVTIPAGATITVAYLSFQAAYSYSAGVTCRIFANDTSTPAVPTTAAEYAAKVCSSEYSDWTVGAITQNTWYNSASIEPIVSELVASYDYSSGLSLLILCTGTNAADAVVALSSYDKSGNTYGPKLHIEYTEVAAGGKPLYAYAQQ